MTEPWRATIERCLTHPHERPKPKGRPESFADLGAGARERGFSLAHRAQLLDLVILAWREGMRGGTATVARLSLGRLGWAKEEAEYANACLTIGFSRGRERARRGEAF